MTDFTNPPIKRHEALVPLSRDHFTGLARAQRLIKSGEGDRVARHKAIADFLDAWNAEIAEHFDDEERLFEPYLTDADRQRLLHEHKQLRDLAEEARQLRKGVDPSPERVVHIGEALRDHIRWEERELFTRLEKTIDAAGLAAIAEHTAEIERSRPRSAEQSRDEHRETH